MDLDSIIEFGDEDTNLDFKREEYVNQNYKAMLKDVMSMANALNNHTKRIIIGVKDTPGKPREFIGIDKISDQAIFENLIQENIEPLIKFRYYSHTFKGVTLGILEIFDTHDKPYMMKKDYDSLKIGDVWIRKGSRQSRFRREDYDNILDFNIKRKFHDKVHLSFKEDLNTHTSLSIKYISNDTLPSKKRILELDNFIKELDKKYDNTIENKNFSDLNKAKNFLEKHNKINPQSYRFIDDSKSICIGYDSFKRPIYKNKDELINMIDSIPDKYFDNDQYYKFEKNGTKVNFYILNNSDEFLEDVIIELKFDANIFDIADQIYKKPSQFQLYHPSLYETNTYPLVYVEDNIIYVKETYQNIRHKEPKKIFFEDLRILKKLKSYSNAEISYKISAKNLPNPILGILELNLT